MFTRAVSWQHCLTLVHFIHAECAAISSHMFCTLQRFSVVESCWCATVFPVFVASSAKLSPTSRYYLYGSPFTCMLAVHLCITWCIVLRILHSTLYYRRLPWYSEDSCFCIVLCCGWHTNVYLVYFLHFQVTLLFHGCWNFAHLFWTLIIVELSSWTVCQWWRHDFLCLLNHVIFFHMVLKKVFVALANLHHTDYFNRCWLYFLRGSTARFLSEHCSTDFKHVNRSIICVYLMCRIIYGRTVNWTQNWHDIFMQWDKELFSVLIYLVSLCIAI